VALVLASELALLVTLCAAVFEYRQAAVPTDAVTEVPGPC